MDGESDFRGLSGADDAETIAANTNSASETQTENANSVQLDESAGSNNAAATYAENLATQLRKGFMAYCVLAICAGRAHYTGDIIKRLHDAELMVVEGTIYPLLGRLQKDGLLGYEWQESEQGPPRKYYAITDMGRAVQLELKSHIKTLNATLKTLEKGAKA